MAQSSTYPRPPACPIIISPQFVAPTPVNLSIARMVKNLKHGEFVVMNIDGNILFKVKEGSSFSLHESRILVDAAEKPIVTLREKYRTLHDRWYAYKGDSKDSKDLLFTVKQSSMLRSKTKFEVFLPHNTEENVCDFKVGGNWAERSCAVYAGESSTIVAQMDRRITGKNLLTGMDNFMVTVYPNVDYGFIVALIVLLTTIYDDANADAETVNVAKATGDVVSVISYLFQ